MKIILSQTNERLELESPAEALTLAEKSPIFLCNDAGEPTHALLSVEEYQRRIRSKP